MYTEWKMVRQLWKEEEIVVKSVLDYLESSNAKYGDKVAVVEGEEQYTYGQLTARAKALGTFLAHKKLERNAPVVSCELCTRHMS